MFQLCAYTSISQFGLCKLWPSRHTRRARERELVLSRMVEAGGAAWVLGRMGVSVSKLLRKSRQQNHLCACLGTVYRPSPSLPATLQMNPHSLTFFSRKAAGCLGLGGNVVAVKNVAWDEQNMWNCGGTYFLLIKLTKLTNRHTLLHSILQHTTCNMMSLTEGIHISSDLSVKLIITPDDITRDELQGKVDWKHIRLPSLSRYHFLRMALRFWCWYMAWWVDEVLTKVEFPFSSTTNPPLRQFISWMHSFSWTSH